LIRYSDYGNNKSQHESGTTVKINFKLLLTFLAVAEHSSFKKAADALFISMPAVSMQIKQLEEQLGAALFQRTTRKVDLTAEGEQLMITARRAMAELDSGLARLQQTVDVQQGHLSFGCVPTIASTRLPTILTQFAKKYPGVSLHVRELAQRELLEAVRRSEVDFGIGPVEEKSDLDFSSIFIDEYVALLPKSYEDKGRAGISLRELSKLPLLTLGASTLFREHLNVALTTNGLVAERNYEFTHVTTLVAMAEAGLGIAILPRVAIPEKTRLKTVKIINPVLTRTIGIVKIKGHTLSPAAARLVDLCNQQLVLN
jgi:DNA-binding transcriptional LysR family regulator